jgi:hypothetical protein
MLSKLLVSKYYMDCIDERGNLFIGYSSLVKWQKFRFNYSNFLFYDVSKSEFRADYSIKKHSFPDWMPPRLSWQNQTLKITGEWKSLQTPVEEKLFEDEKTSIVWSCLQPLSEAAVQLGGNLIEGVGYTERLDLEINPLQLPFETLRWGRFVAKETSMVWIEWQGEIPLKLVFLNGIKYQNVEITDELIRIPDIGLELKLTESLELRKGSLLDTVFKNLQWLSHIFPLKMLNTFECKWRSNAVLTDKNEERTVKSGWAIHEIVIWE